MDKKPENKRLKNIRENLLLSIDDTHEALNIDKKYLEVLEDPEKGVKALEKIVAPVYAHSYHRIYKQYLNLQEEISLPNLTPQKKDKNTNKLISTICVFVAVGILLFM